MTNLPIITFPIGKDLPETIQVLGLLADHRQNKGVVDVVKHNKQHLQEMPQKRPLNILLFFKGRFAPKRR